MLTKWVLCEYWAPVYVAPVWPRPAPAQRPLQARPPGPPAVLQYLTGRLTATSGPGPHTSVTSSSGSGPCSLRPSSGPGRHGSAGALLGLR